MTKEWVFHCGWEPGKLLLGNVLSEQPYTFINQDCWNLGAGSPAIQDADAGGNVRSGRYACEWPIAGFGKVAFQNPNAVLPRTKNFLWYVHGIDMRGSSGGGTPQGGDRYILARYCDRNSGSSLPGTYYFGLEMVIQVVGPPRQVNFRIVYFNKSTGAYVNPTGSTSPNFVVPTGWLWLAFQIDVTSQQHRLFVNDVGVGSGPTAFPGSMVTEGYILPDNSFQAGKGGDIGPRIHYDDWGSCQGDDAINDRPTASTKMILYQPNCDVDGFSDWTGAGETTHGKKYGNWDDVNDDNPVDPDYNDPTADGQKQASKFADEASGLVEGARFHWDDIYSGVTPENKLSARSDAASWIELANPSNGIWRAVGREWHGRQMKVNPEGNGWTTARFNSLEGMLEQIPTGGINVGEFYVVAVGQNLIRPAKTVTPVPACPVGALIISPSGIVSVETFGTCTLLPGAVSILPTGMASVEAFGTPLLNYILSLLGITSSESFGTAIIQPGNVNIIPAGIISNEVFGTHILLPGTVSLLPISIISEELFGTAVLALYLNPPSITAEEAFGTAVLTSIVYISPTAISSAEAFGNATIILYLLPAGISPEELFGTHLLNLTLLILSITSEEAFGLSTLHLILFPTGVVSSEAFGTAIIVLGLFTIFPDAIASQEIFGAIQLVPGSVIISNAGNIASQETVSNPQLNLFLTPTGILTNEAFGVVVVLVTLPIISPAGISTAEAFGVIVIVGGVLTALPLDITVVLYPGILTVGLERAIIDITTHLGVGDIIKHFGSVDIAKYSGVAEITKHKPISIMDITKYSGIMDAIRQSGNTDIVMHISTIDITKHWNALDITKLSDVSDIVIEIN